MPTIKGSFVKYGNTVVSYEITEEQQQAIVKRLMEYYEKNLWYGEGIHQDDDSIINAPSVMSDICDNIIKFVQSPKED